MEFVTLGLVALATLGCFAAVGGCIAYGKRRKPLEGFLLGATLGPVGLIMELIKPFGRRPVVDRGAQNSFRSLVDYQSKQVLLHLPEPATKTSHAPARLALRQIS